MLKENNVRLIGVGLEAVGVKEFIDAKYLEGGKVLKNFYLMLWTHFVNIHFFKSIYYFSDKTTRRYVTFNRYLRC